MQIWHRNAKGTRRVSWRGISQKLKYLLLKLTGNLQANGCESWGWETRSDFYWPKQHPEEEGDEQAAGSSRMMRNEAVCD